MNKRRVIVLMGGKTPEHEVSLASGREVVKNLDKRKYEVLPVVISKDGQKWELKSPEQILLYSPGWSTKESKRELVAGGELLKLESVSQKADVVFIAIHGPYGEDGTVQGMLELAGIPYIGAGVLASALGMDKPMFRKIMERERILVPKYMVLGEKDRPVDVWKNFKLPVVVKPSSQGSSVGVTLVRKKSDLQKALDLAFQYGPDVIVEEYLKGIEVTCGVLGNKKPFALPLVEIVPKKEFFDYEAKYFNGKCEEIVPARISAKLTEKVQKISVKVYKAINCRGFGRVDLIIRQGKPYVLEINTIPGLTPNSLLPKEAAAAGISYPKLLDKLIELALEGC